MRPQMLEVLPAILVAFARAGTLDVENDLRARIDRRDVDRSRRLDQHFESVIAEPLDQLERFRLRQRLAARHLDELAAVALHAIEHFVDRHPLATSERVLRVAPHAAEIAAGEAHEDAGTSGVRRLALDRIEDLSYPHTSSGPQRPPLRIPSFAKCTSRSARTRGHARRGR